VPARRLTSAAARRPAILVGMGETAGYCGRLVDGFRSLGLRADHFDLGPDPLRYGTAPPPPPIAIARWLAARRRAGPGPRALWAALHRLAMAWLFLGAVLRYDAFVLRAGDSFFALRDLPLLRRLGKRVVVVFFGSDSRPSYLNGAELATRDGPSLAATTASKRRMVERTERHATAIVCHVLSAHLHRRRAVRFLEVGIPRPSLHPGPRRLDPDGPVRFLHAPSRSVDKGTARIEAAVASLRAQGLPIELRIVAGRPNAEVLDAIRDCDVVIDQLYSDTPMAALAAEAASLGRPAIVGGYGWDVLNAMGDPERLPPTHCCRPEEIEQAIRLLASDPAYRAELGERARRFLDERWAPGRVAERMLEVIGGTEPEAWWFDPTEVLYAHGAGAPDELVADGVRRVLAAAGPDGLAVAGRPDLLDRLVALIGTQPSGEPA
jgi:hypothetical protein